MESRCYNHPDKEATGTCHYCGRNLCSECLTSGRLGQYYSCINEGECLAYQEGQEVPVSRKAVFDNYITDESTLKRCLERLREIQDELGEISKLMGELAGVTETELETEKVNTWEVSETTIPELCAYKLAEEGMTLLELTALRIGFLRRKCEQAGDSTKLQEVTALQDHIRDDLEPLMRRTLEQMASCSTMDTRKILEALFHD